MVHIAKTWPLPLPSTFGVDNFDELDLTALATKELQLWEGHANDALYGVRMALGEKSSLFRNDLCLANSKLKKGRAWSKVHAVSWWVQHHHQIYNTAQNGLVQLSASEDIQTKYQVLHWNQLKVTTQILQWDRSTPRVVPIDRMNHWNGSGK